MSVVNAMSSNANYTAEARNEQPDKLGCQTVNAGC